MLLVNPEAAIKNAFNVKAKRTHTQAHGRGWERATVVGVGRVWVWEWESARERAQRVATPRKAFAQTALLLVSPRSLSLSFSLPLCALCRLPAPHWVLPGADCHDPWPFLMNYERQQHNNNNNAERISCQCAHSHTHTRTAVAAAADVEFAHAPHCHFSLIAANCSVSSDSDVGSVVSLEAATQSNLLGRPLFCVCVCVCVFLFTFVFVCRRRRRRRRHAAVHN